MGLRGRAAGQRGIGLVEVVVASGLLGVALMVLLSNLSTVVIGGRVAERRIVEERLARNQMEALLQGPVGSCPSPTTQTVDNIAYKVTVACTPQTNLVHYLVTITDGSNADTKLVDDRWTP